MGGGREHAQINLNNIKWKPFKIKDLFTIEHGKRLTKENRKVGNIPFLTASENNQGVSGFIDNDGLKAYKDFISIDMFGHAFYHKYSCSGDDNIYFLINDNIKPYAKVFIAICINNNKSKYSFGNQFRQQNAQRDTILLPVDTNGNPNYQLMEDYIESLIIKKKKDYLMEVKQKCLKSKIESGENLK